MEAFENPIKVWRKQNDVELYAGKFVDFLRQLYKVLGGAPITAKNFLDKQNRESFKTALTDYAYDTCNSSWTMIETASNWIESEAND